MKNRNSSKPTVPRKRSNRAAVKFRATAGSIARMGMISEARYRLFGQKGPSARLENSLRSPSLAILFEKIFRPEMQSEFLVR